MMKEKIMKMLLEQILITTILFKSVQHYLP